MATAQYTVVTGGAVALAAATAKSILGVKAHANHGLALKKFRVGFDGVTASAVPVLVEVCYSTFATNGTAGTNNTSVTPAQTGGRALTASWTAMKNWTSEPTVLTVVEELLLTPNGGLVMYDWPLDDEPDCAVSEGFVLRCTAPAIVNVRASMAVVRV